MIEYTDLIVRTKNPQVLDATVQQLGPAAVIDGSFNGDTCRVRVFGNAGFIKFAIKHQGYGEIVESEDAMSGIPTPRKPCPFCGCPRIEVTYIRDGSAMVCYKCGARTHAFNPDATEKAIAKWNERFVYDSRIESVDAHLQQIEKLRAALTRISNWEMPATDEKWPDGSPVSYGALYGSNGERDVIRDIARAALAESEVPL